MGKLESLDEAPVLRNNPASQNQKGKNEVLLAFLLTSVHGFLHVLMTKLQMSHSFL